MPDRTLLKLGDRIRLLRVPDLDLEQRERERLAGTEGAGMTADAIEQILALDPVVTISLIKNDLAWFEYDLTDNDGNTIHHCIAVMEDESWCLS